MWLLIFKPSINRILKGAVNSMSQDEQADGLSRKVFWILTASTLLWAVGIIIFIL